MVVLTKVGEFMVDKVYNTFEAWKDTVLKLLVGAMVSNILWIFFWAQGVATEQWVIDNPVIYRSIPNLRKAVDQVDANTVRIQTLEFSRIELAGSVQALEKSSNNLYSVVQELNKNMGDLRITIAKWNKEQ